MAWNGAALIRACCRRTSMMVRAEFHWMLNLSLPLLQTSINDYVTIFWLIKGNCLQCYVCVYRSSSAYCVAPLEFLWMVRMYIWIAYTCVCIVLRSTLETSLLAARNAACGCFDLSGGAECLVYTLQRPWGDGCFCGLAKSSASIVWAYSVHRGNKTSWRSLRRWNRRSLEVI